MNEYLAQLYGTGQTAGQDSLEKTAAVEVLSALAEEQGEDLSDVDWDEVSEEEINALIDEEVGFEKEAAPGAGAAVATAGSALNKAKNWLFSTARHKKALTSAKAAFSPTAPGATALTFGQRAAHAGDAALRVAPEIVGGGLVLKGLSGKQSEASVLDEVVAARALEMLDADGWDLDKLAELQERQLAPSKKKPFKKKMCSAEPELAKNSSALDTLAELRAVEFLDNLGLLED